MSNSLSGIISSGMRTLFRLPSTTPPPANTTATTTGKRKAEDAAPLESPSKKHAGPTQIDNIRKIFDKFVHTIDEHEPKMRIISDILTTDDDVCICLHETPLKQIKKHFKLFIGENQFSAKFQTRIWNILRNVYPTVLENSSSHKILCEVSNALPKMQATLKEHPGKIIHDLLRDARVTCRRAPECKNVEEINRILPRIHLLMNKLNDYRNWKQYQDPEENERILFLARYYNQEDTHSFSNVVVNYQHVVEEINELTPDIKCASAMFLRLNSLKLQLQQKKTALTSPAAKENSLETRFINGFAPAFYDAFGHHFWNLLEQSQGDTEVNEIVNKISNWDKIQNKPVNHTLVNSIWAAYLPDHQIEDWILATLGSMSKEGVDKLEDQLQDLQKEFNKIHEDKSIPSAEKEQDEDEIQEKMNQLCFDATVPDFSTLSKLKWTLNSKTTQPGQTEK